MGEAILNIKGVAAISPISVCLSSLENGPGYGVNILTMLYVLASKKPPKSYSYKLLITLLPTKQLSNQSSTLAVVFNDSQPLKGTTLKNRIHITLKEKIYGY